MLQCLNRKDSCFLVNNNNSLARERVIVHNYIATKKLLPKTFLPNKRSSSQKWFKNNHFTTKLVTANKV